MWSVGPFESPGEGSGDGKTRVPSSSHRGTETTFLTRPVQSALRGTHFCPLDLVGLPDDSLVNVLRRVQGILRIWEGFLAEVGFTVEHGGRDEKGEERPCGGGDDPVIRGREGHGFLRESEEEK